VLDKEQGRRFEHRRISRSAAHGSGIEQSVQVITTVSMLSSVHGIAVPFLVSGSPGTGQSRPRPAMSSNPFEDRGRMTSAYRDIESEVQARADPTRSRAPRATGTRFAAVLLDGT